LTASPDALSRSEMVQLGILDGCQPAGLKSVQLAGAAASTLAEPAGL